MGPKCVPMIHVPDVRATVTWYERIGFNTVTTYDDGGEGLSFAMMAFGPSEVMFSSGGRPSTQHRREVDLYVYTENVDALHERIAGWADVVEGPHDMFYGMREVIIRDVNRFWITFGETSPGALLMEAVREGNLDGVRRLLERPGLSPERLSAAIGAVAGGGHHAEIVALLEGAGGTTPPAIPVDTLSDYAGRYTGEQGFIALVGLYDGSLLVAPDDGPPVWLLPATGSSFRPIDLPDALVTFIVEDGRAVGLDFTQGQLSMRLRKVSGP